MKDITVDDLKCCGNCKYRVSDDFGKHVEEFCKYDILMSYEVCDFWEYDEMSNYRKRNTIKRF